MFAFLPSRRVLCGVFVVALGAGSTLAVQAQPLSFEHAQALAERTAPENLARLAQVESAQSSVSRAEAEQRAALLEIKRQTALGWLEVYYAERSVQLFDQLDRQIALLRTSTQSRVAGGGAQAGDVLQADQEALTLEDRRDELTRNVAMARAKLRRWVGDEANQPLSGAPPTLNLTLPHSQHGLQRHPDLQAASARVSEANAELAEAIAQKKPDWGVELAYNNRDNRFGDMVSVQFTFDLPMFVGSRQGPRINARQHSVEQMEAEQEVMVREHQAALESGLAELDQLKKSLERTEHSLIPLATRRTEFELASYKAGTRQLNAVIAARRDLIEAQLRQIEQQNKLSQLSASLYYAYVEGLK